MTVTAVQGNYGLYRAFPTYVLDDEYLVVETWEAWLNNAAWPVVGKSYDTENAFREITQLRPEIVLADIQFGERRNAGIELIENVRSTIEGKGQRIPFVIFITGFADFAQTATSGIPFAKVLSKPLREADLKNALVEAASRVSQFRQLRDAQWVLKKLSSDGFIGFDGDFVGVFDQNVVACGDDESTVRLKVAQKFGVPKEEVIVEYKGEVF